MINFTFMKKQILFFLYLNIEAKNFSLDKRENVSTSQSWKKTKKMNRLDVTTQMKETANK